MADLSITNRFNTVTPIGLPVRRFKNRFNWKYIEMSNGLLDSILCEDVEKCPFGQQRKRINLNDWKYTHLNLKFNSVCFWLQRQVMNIFRWGVCLKIANIVLQIKNSYQVKKKSLCLPEGKILVMSALNFKARVDPSFAYYLPVYSGFLRFTSGAIPAVLWSAWSATGPFWPTYLHISTSIRGTAAQYS